MPWLDNSVNQCNIEKPKISIITCIECNLKQEPFNVCIGCNINFARSFCNKCNIWTQKNITHCNNCGICRVGKKEEIQHYRRLDGLKYKNSLNYNSNNYQYNKNESHNNI